MVRTLEENYLDLTVEEIYSIIDLSDHMIPWPNNFTSEKKTKFLESIRDYFINKEEYENCKSSSINIYE